MSPPIGIGLSLANISAPFSPTELSNLFFWVRADRGVTLAIGTKVSNWNDQSGNFDTNHNLINPTDGTQPSLNTSDVLYNNQSTISFTRANNTFLQGAGNLSPHLTMPSTIYVVANSDGANVYYEDVLDGNDVTGDRQQLYFITGFWSITAGGVNSGPTTNSTASPSVFCCIFNGPSSSKLYISAATDSPVSPQPPVSDLGQIVLGNTRNGGGFGLQGKIAEVIAYSGSHDASTRAKVMSYLGTRYGIVIGS